MLIRGLGVELDVHNQEWSTKKQVKVCIILLEQQLFHWTLEYIENLKRSNVKLNVLFLLI